jgi:tight adherence protein C
MLVLIAITSFTAIAFAVVALGQRSPNPARMRVRSLGLDGGGFIPSDDRPFASRVMLPAAKRLGDGLLALLPHRWLRRLDQALMGAGQPMDSGSFMLLWAVTGIGASVAGAVFFDLRGLLLFGAVGFLVPLYLLRRVVRRRRRRISNALPDAIDLLVTCVEAGLGLDAAMIRLGEATEGPLGDEVNITLREIAVGRPRHEALLDLGSRSGVKDLDGFIRPIVQAERSGVSIGTALRVQAESLRIRRRQRAQEAAQKLPVKMTIPIGLFFIPAVLIIGIAPAIFSVSDFLQGR